MNEISKDYILREIKRTALENNNSVLGIRAFCSATGLRERDMLGKFWSTWNEAIQEAGLEPNKKTEPYSEQFLFNRFVECMRKVGHFPTDNNLRLWAKNNPDFPSETTFRRFGNKTERASKIKELCGNRSDFQDVIGMCDEVIGELVSTPQGLPKADAAIEDVYLMKSGKNYKIGRSNSAGRRAYELKTQMPERLEIVHTIRTDDPSGIEEYWHKRFKAKRKNGEWFALDAKEVAIFKRRKFM